MFYINDGFRIEKVEEILDKEESDFLKKFNNLAYPTGKELRNIAEQRKGEWESIGNGIYDILNMPFLSGTLIIQRPFPNLKEKKYQGHQVSYKGDIFIGIEEYVEVFILELLKREKYEAKKDFLEYEVESSDRRDWIEETVKLFE